MEMVDVYFWNAKALARDLRDNKVSEKEKLKYFLLTNSLLFIPVGGEEFTWSEEAFFASIFFLGTLWCYEANQRGDDRDFIARTTCLLLPVALQVVVIGTVGYIITIIIAIVFQVLIEHYIFHLAWNDIKNFQIAGKDFWVYGGATVTIAALFWWLRSCLLIASGADEQREETKKAAP
jgi:hypothetical protein